LKWALALDFPMPALKRIMIRVELFPERSSAPTPTSMRRLSPEPA
jgi:hypothetical protein